eukprot:UN27372
MIYSMPPSINNTRPFSTPLNIMATSFAPAPKKIRGALNSHIVGSRMPVVQFKSRGSGTTLKSRGRGTGLKIRGTGTSLKTRGKKTRGTLKSRGSSTISRGGILNTYSNHTSQSSSPVVNSGMTLKTRGSGLKTRGRGRGSPSLRSRGRKTRSRGRGRGRGVLNTNIQ